MQVHIKEVWMLKLQFFFLSDYFPVSTNLKDFIPARVDSSDERDVLQIETEEFQDSDDSEMGIEAREERENLVKVNFSLLNIVRQFRLIVRLKSLQGQNPTFTQIINQA